MSIFARKVRRAVGKLSPAHALEEGQVLFHRSVSVRAGLAGLSQSAAHAAHLFGREVADVRLPFLDRLDRKGVHVVEVVAPPEYARRRILFTDPNPFGPQPPYVLDDRLDVFLLFLAGVGVVHPQIELSAETGGDAVVEADALGMPDVQVSIGLRWEPGVYAAPELSGLVVFEDDFANEIDRRRGLRGAHVLQLRLPC